MNVVWSICVIICFTLLTVSSPNAAMAVALNSASQAVSYAAQLISVYALWLGIFEIAERCNAVNLLAKAFGKINGFLYGAITPQAAKYVSLNMASNLLGIGNAATPSAIEAIKLTENSETLSRSGAMLFVLNASGVQLVPTTIIGLRASIGSANSSSILLPTLIVTAVTAVIGVFLVNLAYGRAPK